MKTKMLNLLFFAFGVMSCWLQVLDTPYSRRILRRGLLCMVTRCYVKLCVTACSLTSLYLYCNAEPMCMFSRSIARAPNGYLAIQSVIEL